jgi:hypothetical protein
MLPVCLVRFNASLATIRCDNKYCTNHYAEGGWWQPIGAPFALKGCCLLPRGRPTSAVIQTNSPLINIIIYKWLTNSIIEKHKKKKNQRKRKTVKMVLTLRPPTSNARSKRLSWSPRRRKLQRRMTQCVARRSSSKCRCRRNSSSSRVQRTQQQLLPWQLKSRVKLM